MWVMVRTGLKEDTVPDPSTNWQLLINQFPITPLVAHHINSCWCSQLLKTTSYWPHHQLLAMLPVADHSTRCWTSYQLLIMISCCSLYQLMALQVDHSTGCWSLYQWLITLTVADHATSGWLWHQLLIKLPGVDNAVSSDNFISDWPLPAICNLFSILDTGSFSHIEKVENACWNCINYGSELTSLSNLKRLGLHKVNS